MTNDHIDIQNLFSSQHADEERYMFATPSTMKPTQIQCSEGAVNQIPAWTEVKGQFMYYIMTTIPCPS